MAANPIDFTTLAVFKAYANVPNPIAANADDATFQLLLTSASQTALSYLSRSPFVVSYTELQDGHGTDLLVLKNWPVVLISSLLVISSCSPWGAGLPWFSSQPQIIPPSVNGSPGFVFDPDTGVIALIGGYTFSKGRRNVTVVYQAGFAVTMPEVQPIIGGTVALMNGATFLGDKGVTYQSTGVALINVASAPAVGQYTVSAIGSYGFNVADENTIVVVDYSFQQIPYDLQTAVCEIGATEYSRRKHPDEEMSLVGGTNVSFMKLPIPRLAQMRLDQYKNRMGPS